MKKYAIVAILLLYASLSFGQANAKYRRYGKLTTSEINNINTTRSDVVYYAYDTDLGYEVANYSDGNGWVQRFISGAGGSGDFLANGSIPMTGNLQMGTNNIQNVELVSSERVDAGLLNAPVIELQGGGVAILDGGVFANHSLNIPNESTPPTTDIRAGSVYRDSSLGDGELYMYDGAAWNPVGGGGTGTDDQTIAEVLAEGNDAGGANINNIGIAEVNELRVTTIVPSGTPVISVGSGMTLNGVGKLEGILPATNPNDAVNLDQMQTAIAAVTVGGLTLQGFQDLVYETELPNGTYVQFIKSVSQVEYDNLSNEDVYGLNGVSYYVPPSVPSGYSISNIDLTTITAPTFAYASGEINAGLDWSITDGTATIAGILRPITTASGTVTMTDLTSLADGTLTLTVSLMNGGGRGSNVTDTATKGSVSTAVQHYENRAGALVTGSDTSVAGWVSGNGISESSTTVVRGGVEHPDATGTISLRIASNDGTSQFRSFDFSSGSSGQNDFVGGETATVTGWIYAPTGADPEILLTNSTLTRQDLTFTANTWTQFTISDVNITSSGSLFFYTSSTSGIYIDDLTIISN